MLRVMLIPLLIAQMLVTTGTSVVDSGSCALAPAESERAPSRLTVSYALLKTILASEEASEEQVAQIKQLSAAYGHAIEAGNFEDVQSVSSSRWWAELGLEGCDDVIASVHDEPDPNAFTLEVTRSYSFGDGAVAAFLDRTFVESGELTVFFVVLTPDHSGDLKIDYFNQRAEFNDLRSAEGLDVDDGYVLSVPWAEVQLHGVPDLPAGTTVLVDDGPCTLATLASGNATSQAHTVERGRPTYWTISYELLETIVVSEHPAFATFLKEKFVEPGELRVRFNFQTSGDLGKREIIDYFNQHSSAGLDIDDYGVLSVPWAEIQQHGLPDLPASAAVVTLTCS